MELKDFLNSLPDEGAFAIECGAASGHLRNVAYGDRIAGPRLCTAIEQASNGKVTRQELRPDDWMLIWPELAEAKAA